MTDNDAGAPESDRELAADWTTAVAMPLVRGLSHALSNRVGALAVLLEVVLDPELAADERATYEAQVRKEMGQLEELNGQLRLVTPDRAGPEPLMLADAVTAATGLATLHRDRRGGALRVSVEGNGPPVRVSRWALVHSLVAMMDVVQRRNGVEAVMARLGGSSDEATLTVVPEHHAMAAPAPHLDDDVSRRTAERLAGTMHGRVEDGPSGGLVLTLPTLAALRARAGRG